MAFVAYYKLCKAILEVRLEEEGVGPLPELLAVRVVIVRTDLFYLEQGFSAQNHHRIHVPLIVATRSRNYKLGNPLLDQN